MRHPISKHFFFKKCVHVCHLSNRYSITKYIKLNNIMPLVNVKMLEKHTYILKKKIDNGKAQDVHLNWDGAQDDL